MSAKIVRPVIRWGGALLCATAAVWCMNLAFFHGWAAGFPEAEAAAWHRRWSDIFFGVALTMFILAVICIWRFRRCPERNGRRLV